MKSDEFIREVDEELQREKLALLWKRWGNLVIAGAVGIVLATAGWVGWQRWQESERRAEAARFAAVEQLLVEGRDKDAAAALRGFAGEASAGFATLARLLAAAAAERANDPDAALADLEAVIRDPKADPLLKEAAGLLEAAHRLDREDPKALAARLEPLAVDGAPFRHAALQLLAAARLRAGEREAAVAALRRLAEDPDTPTSTRLRASELLDALGAPLPRATS